jgi:hypothetical protein
LVQLQTRCSRTYWFTVRLYDSGGVGLPTTAAGHPGLTAAVSRNTGGTFSPAGYAGSGRIGGVNDAGFFGAVSG